MCFLWSSSLFAHRFLSNIDSHFAERTYLVFPSKSIETDGVKAGVMSSFGFGQVGGTALIVHPRYLFGALEPFHYQVYQKRRQVRQLGTYKTMSEMMIKNNLVKIKEKPPFTPEYEDKVLLNSLARTVPDAKTGSYVFAGKLPTAAPLDVANVKAVADAMEAASNSADFVGVGVDQGAFFCLEVDIIPSN